MHLSDTLYGKEIWDSIKKARKRNLKLLVGLGLFWFLIFAGVGYLFYVEGELEKLKGEAAVFCGIVIAFFVLIVIIVAARTPEKNLQKIMNRSLKTEEMKRMFVEELNEKPSGILQLKKKAGKILFTKHFLVQYSEKKSALGYMQILRLDDMDYVSIFKRQSYGITVSYSHKYEKRTDKKCVQRIDFMRKSDSEEFLNRMFMLRPQLEIKK